MHAESPASPSLQLIDSVDSGLHDLWITEISDESSPSQHELGVEGLTTEHVCELDPDVNDALGPQGNDRPVVGNVVVELPFSTLTQPASHYEGFVPPAPERSEKHALDSLLGKLGTKDNEDGYVELELDHFSIYIDNSTFPNELRPLQHLVSRTVKCMYFDGVLQHGDSKFYLRRVPFYRLPVGNYGESTHTVGGQIWILSKLNESLGRAVYYRLRLPAPEYQRFHTPFLWIADLAKHVIDYCEYRREENTHVVLRDLRSRFSFWLMSIHEGSAVFQKWHAVNANTDFRGAFIANMDYIFEEANGLDPDITSWHHIWREVKTLDHYQPNLGSCLSRSSSELLDHVEVTPNVGRNDAPSKTIVTPYVYNLFSHMVFGMLLEQKEISLSVEMRKTIFIKNTESMHTQNGKFRSIRRSSIDHTALVESIEPGDVISTLPDDNATTDTEWKRELSKHYQGEYRWFGLVRKVYNRSYGKRSFDILWLYQSIDTPCSVMKYPWANELFLSDNCTCHAGISSIAKVQGHQILSTHEVEWFGSPSTSAEFFVRQTYVASDRRWTSLRKEHLVCGDETAFSKEPDPSTRYQVGHTVLVETKRMHLETFIIECSFEEKGTRYARMRRLWRRRDVDKTARLAPPNELVYSRQIVEIHARKINRRCLVRTFCPHEEIPPPYNRDGTGDAFFIRYQETEAEGITEYRPLDSRLLELFRQGFDPSNTKLGKLQGLDLFCGGGNLGRGIEEGGAVEMKWANDIWEGAIHTYMANTNPAHCTPFLGSVDDLLGHALEGEQGVPTPGDVHFIGAGSPCPGFSSLTADKTTSHQRKNQSFVASFASYVELYRPLYGVLENVPNMVMKGGSRDSCVFSQLVCALVGLGYQVQILLLDAWSFGSAQKRSRVFLAFTAPGLRMPKAPKASHSHPDGIPLRKLGEMSCGRPFDSGERVPTPFKFVSMRNAVGDLPNIQDGKADYCVGYPDHRLSMYYSAAMRKQLQHIPTHPYGMNFAKSWWGAPGLPRVMTEIERSLFPKDGSKRVTQKSKGWGRVNPNGLIGTIPTKCTPTDLRIGQMNHWEQNRPTTVMEARRAQGFPDHEVLVGSRAEQYKIIGNSVSRHVALALGLAIREAWLGTLWDEDVDTSAEILQVQNHTSLNRASTDSSEDPSTTSTPRSLGLFTPATSESDEPLDNKIHRKRTLPIYVEIFAKKCRRDIKTDEFLPVE
ncbi:S-adenosyl-L-methionine-dependent methyltransferase [Xylaria cf. heliscus]|nr:S-adenosyl-L-methionine-dependent methyltransferase [Xylaria cf. heliscus]